MPLEFVMGVLIHTVEMLDSNLACLWKSMQVLAAPRVLQSTKVAGKNAQ